MSNAVVPELSVSDWRKSLRFYCDVLGFNIDYQRREEGFACLRLGPAELMFDQIGVANVTTIGASLRAHGVPLVLPMEEHGIA